MSFVAFLFSKCSPYSICSYSGVPELKTGKELTKSGKVGGLRTLQEEEGEQTGRSSTATVKGVKY